MGKSAREHNKSFGEPSVPGPGNYNYKESLGAGPKYTMVGRHNNEKDQFVPGPGHYNGDIDYNLIRSKNPSWKYPSLISE
jgi:hypothetical protein